MFPLTPDSGTVLDFALVSRRWRNAVIGVDFDYLTLDPETASNQGGTLYLPYVFGVTANGNAVIIEKNERAAGI